MHERMSFCAKASEGIAFVGESEVAVSFMDAFPVSEGHVLVVPRRHLARVEDLDPDEWAGVVVLVHRVSRELADQPGIDGLNVGVNSGVAAGQTVDHAHVHVMPRWLCDVLDPRGGVRRVIPGRAAYWNQA